MEEEEDKKRQWNEWNIKAQGEDLVRGRDQQRGRQVGQRGQVRKKHNNIYQEDVTMNLVLYDNQKTVKWLVCIHICMCVYIYAFMLCVLWFVIHTDVLPDFFGNFIWLTELL